MVICVTNLRPFRLPPRASWLGSGNAPAPPTAAVGAMKIEEAPVLGDLLRAVRKGSDSEAVVRQILARYVTPHVDDLVSEAVTRGALAAHDAPDVAHEVALRLLVKLRRLTDTPDEEPPILRLDDYVATIFRHSIEDLRRRLDPPRAKIYHRVRYVLTHTRALALWGHEPLCGLVEWAGRNDSAAVPPSEPLPPAARDDAKALRRLVEHLIRGAGAPVELGVLVDSVATAVGLTDERFVSADTLKTFPLPARGARDLESREYLALLWNEIEQLPVGQRRALLFNLRLDNGDSALRALATLRIAGVRRLAEGLELSLDELLALWRELPLPDARTAKMLGVTRQQVINLRKTARERLSRRMGRARRGRRGKATS